MKASISLAIRSLGLMLGLGACVAAQAANTWYNYGSSSTVAGVEASAFYATNKTDGTNAIGSSTTWTSTTLAWASGYGLKVDSDSTASPNHAVDNSIRTEAILLKFTGGPVALSAIDLSWVGCPDGTNNTSCSDADITIYRYNGSDSTPMTNTASPAVPITASQTGMTTNGWALVGSYADLKEDTNTSSPYNMVNGSTTSAQGALSDGVYYSSWWLISAFNSSLDTTKTLSSGTAGFNNGNDYFKLYSVAASTCTGTVTSGGTCTPPSGGGGKLPEPATLALTGVALLGVMGLRRRKAKLAA